MCFGSSAVLDGREFSAAFNPWRKSRLAESDGTPSVLCGCIDSSLWLAERRPVAVNTRIQAHSMAHATGVYRFDSTSMSNGCDSSRFSPASACRADNLFSRDLDGSDCSFEIQLSFLRVVVDKSLSQLRAQPKNDVRISPGSL